MPMGSNGAPMGSNGAPMGQENLSEFSYIFNDFYSNFGVYIFPKWLIKVPGLIPILFK